MSEETQVLSTYAAAIIPDGLPPLWRVAQIIIHAPQDAPWLEWIFDLKPVVDRRVKQGYSVTLARRRAGYSWEIDDFQFYRRSHKYFSSAAAAIADFLKQREKVERELIAFRREKRNAR